MIRQRVPGSYLCLVCEDWLELIAINLLIKLGFPWRSWLALPSERLVDLKLLEVAGQQLRLSREGLFVSDSIWPELALKSHDRKEAVRIVFNSVQTIRSTSCQFLPVSTVTMARLVDVVT